MEIKISTQQILKILYVLSWIIFVGVSIEAGSFIFYAFSTTFIDPIDAQYLWREVDLSSLYAYDHGYFLIELSLMCIVAVMRACIFYQIIKILHNKKLDLSQPFNKEVRRFIVKVSYLSLLIGLLSSWGVNYAAWFIQQGVNMPDIQYLRLGGADVWLFMGVILLVIAQIFKRGIEIQTENDLTI